MDSLIENNFLTFLDYDFSVGAIYVFGEEWGQKN
jgi:hypothetical protein